MNNSKSLWFPVASALAFLTAAAHAESQLADPVKLAGLKISKLEGPEFADIDGDGEKDLLGGLYSGNLVCFKNEGEKVAPVFGKAKTLSKRGGNGPASYLKLVADDYNGDGKLDLIVGAKGDNRKPAILVYLRK